LKFSFSEETDSSTRAHEETNRRREGERERQTEDRERIRGGREGEE